MTPTTILYTGQTPAELREAIRDACRFEGGALVSAEAMADVYGESFDDAEARATEIARELRISTWSSVTVDGWRFFKAASLQEDDRF